MSGREAIAARWSRFWFESEVLRSRLTAFRVVFFGLLALDLWVLMVPHASRHDLGAFNVSHVPWLDPFIPAPDTSIFTALYLVSGFLSMRIALGLATRESRIALTVLYSTAYLWSQLDSYQHHYLICLLLLLSCFVPFEVTPGLDAARAPEAPRVVRSWAARLIYVQVSIVYFFTAITKANEHWLSGWALERIVRVEGVRTLFADMAAGMGWAELGTYALVAHVIMLWQFFVAVAFLFPRLRPVACVTGPLFHVLVEVLDLKIGWFSYYMIGIYYLLLFPDRWFVGLAKPLERVGTYATHLFDRVVRVGEAPSVYVACGSSALCAAVALLVPLEGVGVAAVTCGLATLAALWPRAELPATSSVARALAHVAIAGSMVLAIRGTDGPWDYYRFWAGDLARRGELEPAAEMYERANAHAPPGRARHARLAEIYERLGRPNDAERTRQQGLAHLPATLRTTEPEPPPPTPDRAP
ncbi:MAG: HTTM domain-containing protein [Sandaracinaceae bacterium]